MNRGETRGRVDEAMGDTGEDAAGEDAALWGRHAGRCGMGNGAPAAGAWRSGR